MKHLIPVIFLCLCIGLSSPAQNDGVSINNTGAPADPSAMLDVSSGSKGLLIPRMTEAQRLLISAPATGLLVYQTDNASGFWYFDGSSWMQAIGPAGPQGPTGPTGPTGSGGSTPCSSPPATPGPVSGNALGCISNPAVYSITPVAGADTYTWTVPAGAIILSGQGTNAIVVRFANDDANVSISVIAGNDCGSSPAPSSLNITTFSTWGAPAIQTYSSPGTYTFTVPPCADHVCIEVWGGGGGGGGGNNNTGGGGGGGGYGRQCFYLAPGSAHTVTVGSGGAGGGPNQTGSPGNISSFGTMISATGGNGGHIGPQGTGGTSTATLNYNGSNGGNGQSSCFGGNGGKGGGPDGGNGGSGGSCNTGSPGSSPGGGGGGVGSNSGYSGGSGAAGRVIITW